MTPHIIPTTRQGAPTHALSFLVPCHRPWKGAPWWRVGYAQLLRRGDPVYLFSILNGDEPVAWFRVDDWWDDVYMLRAPERARCSPLASLRASLIDDAPARGEDGALESYWLRVYFDALVQAHHRVLWAGEWELEYLAGSEYVSRYGFGRRGQFTEEVRQEQRSRAVIASERLGLPWRAKREDELETSRVKYWRKIARRGETPPILVLELDPFGACVVIDGHDRLQAALEARRLPDYVILRALRVMRRDREVRDALQSKQDEIVERIGWEALSRGSFDAIQRSFIDAYREVDYTTRFRVWPHPGGVTEWRRQVWRGGHGLPAEQEREVCATMFFDL